MRLTARPLTAPAFALLLLALAPSPFPTDLRGFTLESAKAEREWETKFRALPSPDSLREYMRHLSARPHHVGSPRSEEHTSELQSRLHLVCRLLLEKKKKEQNTHERTSSR